MITLRLTKLTEFDWDICLGVYTIYESLYKGVPIIFSNFEDDERLSYIVDPSEIMSLKQMTKHTFFASKETWAVPVNSFNKDDAVYADIDCDNVSEIDNFIEARSSMVEYLLNYQKLKQRLENEYKV